MNASMYNYTTYTDPSMHTYKKPMSIVLAQPNLLWPPLNTNMMLSAVLISAKSTTFAAEGGYLSL